MSANQFIHLASLVGLIPLYCFTFANIHDAKLGTAKAISIGLEQPKMKLPDIRTEFLAIVQELKNIWGNMVISALLENVLCEISRCYKQTCKAILKDSSGPCSLGLEVICNTSSNHFKESKARDLFFFDESRNTMQNMFNVTSACSGGSPLRPCLLMRDSVRWNENTSVHNLTNWCGDKNNKKMMAWEHHGNCMKLRTRLFVSQDLKEVMNSRMDSN